MHRGNVSNVLESGLPSILAEFVGPIVISHQFLTRND